MSPLNGIVIPENKKSKDLIITEKRIFLHDAYKNLKSRKVTNILGVIAPIRFFLWSLIEIQSPNCGWASIIKMLAHDLKPRILDIILISIKIILRCPQNRQRSDIMIIIKENSPT